MSQKTALTVIFIIAICGVLFSGYLSYYELFVPGGCGEAVVSCGVKPFTIADLPACVYGLIMYSIVLVISALALFGKKS
jgi:hypothetical protein